MVDARSIPHGLGILLGEKFFDPCIVHKSEKKNEKNIFCLNCCITICPHCLPFHRPHRRLQIRRYVYQDVLRLSDAQKLINCSLVQVNHLETAKRDGKTLDPTSELLPLLYKTRTDASFLKLEEDPQMTPDSVMGSPVSPSTWSGGSTNTTVTSNGNSAINCKPSSLVSTATTEFVKKKKRSCVLMPRGSCRGRCSQAAAAESISHRKGVPQRSPLN